MVIANKRRCRSPDAVIARPVLVRAPDDLSSPGQSYSTSSRERSGLALSLESERAADLNLPGAQAVLILVDANAVEEFRDQLEARDRRPDHVAGIAPGQAIRAGRLDVERRDAD